MSNVIKFKGRGKHEAPVPLAKYSRPSTALGGHKVFKDAVIPGTAIKMDKESILQAKRNVYNIITEIQEKAKKHKRYTGKVARKIRGKGKLGIIVDLGARYLGNK